jgi:hypothetical protein
VWTRLKAEVAGSTSALATLRPLLSPQVSGFFVISPGGPLIPYWPELTVVDRC